MRKPIYIFIALAIIIVAAGFTRNFWERHQFDKTHVAMEGTVVTFKPVAGNAPPGTGPEALIRLDDGREITMHFPSFQPRLKTNDKIPLWFNLNDDSVSPRN